MLHLLHPTDPAWVDAAASDMTGLLRDHAHCELKAAQSALSLVGRFGGEAPELIEPLCTLAREETAHFKQVHDRLEARGVPISIPSTDEYVQRLRRSARVDHQKHPVLLDRLLVCALIEARSCERFKLLSEGLKAPEFRDFYAGLMNAEARHFQLFRGLAEKRFGRGTTHARLKTLAEREAEIAQYLPLGPTVHG